MHAPLVEVHGLDVDTAAGRPLLRDLSLHLGRERVALIGRNGAGKSTLLRILAGEQRVDRGSLVSRTSPVHVRQDPSPDEVDRALRWLIKMSSEDPDAARAVARDAAEAGLAPLHTLAGAPSRGEARKLLLIAARLAAPDLLLLDEPTAGLDEAGVAWLCRWLRAWDRGAIVVSHHRGLLRCFEHFFVVAESTRSSTR